MGGGADVPIGRKEIEKCAHFASAELTWMPPMKVSEAPRPADVRFARARAVVKRNQLALDELT